MSQLVDLIENPPAEDVDDDSSGSLADSWERLAPRLLKVESVVEALREALGRQLDEESRSRQAELTELTALVKKAGEARVKVIFVQPQITGRSAEAVAKAVGAEVKTLDPLAPDVLTNLKAAAAAIAESMR